jgi:hypothetical protein
MRSTSFIAILMVIGLALSLTAVTESARAQLSPLTSDRAFVAKNITTNATTVVKTGSGHLHAVCINTKGATANTLTLFDNTAGSGTKLGTFDTTAATGCLLLDVVFLTGLTAVTAAGTAADLTLSFK